MKNSLQTLQFLQLADSAFPTGEFSYSFGLEAAAHLGQIPTYEALVEYLDAYLRQLSHADLAFINSSYDINPDTETPLLLSVLTEWHAFLTTPSIRHSNRILGENWCELIEVTFKPADLRGLVTAIDELNQPKYFTIVFGILLKFLGYSLSDVQELFLYISLRDQLNAAVRLGLIGSRRSQKVLYQFGPRCCELVRDNKDLDYTMSYKSEPIIEIAQASHHTIYSRLFQN